MHSFKDFLDAKTLNVNKLAKKHGITKNAVLKQLKKGVKVEKEHSSKPEIAKEIAKDHIGEDPKYYDKLAKMERK